MYGHIETPHTHATHTQTHSRTVTANFNVLCVHDTLHTPDFIDINIYTYKHLVSYESVCLDPERTQPRDTHTQAQTHNTMKHSGTIHTHSPLA